MDDEPLTPLTAEALDALAAWQAVSVRDDERCGLSHAVNALLREIPEPARIDGGRPAPARDPGRRPAGDEDPLNAIVRWCSIRGEPAGGPLAGLRVAVKDSMAIAGMPLTCGSHLLRGFVPSEDSAVVRRIVDAGGEIVAIANMDELAVSGAGDSSCYGPILNPFDTTRTAGGSSGGSAACLWYDAVDASLGGDQAGSARIPASWCGVIGLKPTHGLVPCAGVVGLDRSVDHVGVLGRTALEVARVLGALADGRYGAAVERAPPDLDGSRVAVLEQGFAVEAGVDPETAAAVRAAVEELRTLGATVESISLPEHRLGGAIFAGLACQGLAASVESGASVTGCDDPAEPALADAIREGLRSRSHELSPHVKASLLAGWHVRRACGGSVYTRARRRSRDLAGRYDRMLERADVIALPTTPTPARPMPRDDRPVAERVRLAMSNSVNTVAFNLTGHPAISLPLAAVDGLPVGLMLVAPRFQEARLLTLAAVAERRCGWKPAPAGQPRTGR